jgi:RNA polymerase sigma-70 factor, ECF subfamily
MLWPTTTAATTGAALLAEDVVLHADSGGKVGAARVAVRGRWPVAKLTMKDIGRDRDRWTLDLGWFNEGPGVVSQEGDHIPGVVRFDFDGDSLGTLWFLVNPDKMNELNGVRA